MHIYIYANNQDTITSYHHRGLDPFASPDDQPMPQAELPAVQNIYDLQSSWPQQPHVDNGDTLRQPEEHLNQEETIPAKEIDVGFDDERDQECPDETQGYPYAEQNLKEGPKDQVGDSGSGCYIEQEVVEKQQGIPVDQEDPYGIDRVDHVEEDDFETEEDTTQESLNLNLQKAATGTAEATDAKGDLLQQIHLNQQLATADGNVEQVIEKESIDEEQHLNLQEAVVGTALATEVTGDHLDTQEVMDDTAEQVIGKEKDTEEEHLNAKEVSAVDHIKQKDFGTEKETVHDHLEPLEAEITDNIKQEYSDKEEDLPKDIVDSFEATPDNLEQAHFKSEGETQEGLVDSYETTKIDTPEQKDIEEEREITKAYQDPYDVTDANQQVTTTLQQEPIQTSGDPGLNENEEVQAPAEVYQDYALGTVEAAPTNEQEVHVDQKELQEESTQEYPSEKEDYVEKVKEEDITHLSEVIDIGKDSENQDMERMEGASHDPQGSVSLIEPTFTQKPMHSEEQVEREAIGLENQVETEEEQEPEELLDPYAPENADMAESAVTLHSEDSELLGDQPAQQDIIPQEYNDTSLIGAEVGTKETGFGSSEMTPSEDKDVADKHEMLQDDVDFTKTLDNQAEGGNMQLEMPTDPIDAVFKANSQENLLGLDPEAAVCETKQDEPPSENLEPVLEGDQQVTTSKSLEQTDEATILTEEAQSGVVHEPINFPSDEREDVHVDLSNVQDTVVSTTVDAESFQSGSVIESPDSLVSRGLSEVDIEPSQQSAEYTSIQDVPDNVQESGHYDGGECQEEIIGADKSAEQQVESSRSEEEYENETSEPTSQGKAANLPLLDLGDGPVQSLSIADADQSPGQRSFEGSFSPIEDNVAVSLALEDQSHVVESKDQEESDDDAHTETTEVETEVHEDKVEQEIQHEEESTYNTLKEVPTKAGGSDEVSYDKILDEGKDASEAAESQMTSSNIDNDGLVPDHAEISPENPDTMQTKVETYLDDNEKTSEEYNQDHHPQLPEDSMARADVEIEESMNISAAAEASQEVSPEVGDQETPDIVMQEYSEEVEAEQKLHAIPDVSTDATLQNTADKLLGEPEVADALILERSRGSATPPNTPEVVSSSPPEMITEPHQELVREPIRREREAVGDQITSEAEQLALYDDQVVQSEQKQEPPAEEPIQQVDEKLAPEEHHPAASISEDKQSCTEVTAPTIPLSVQTPEVPKAAPAHVKAKDGNMKSSPAKQRKSKAPTDVRSPSKKTIPSAAPKSKSAGKPKGSETPKKTAAPSRSQPKATAPADQKETTKAPSKSPAKIPSRTPTKLPAAKAPVKASPKVSAPSPARPTSAKKTPGQASVGVTHTRPKTVPPKMDSKLSESKPKQDKVKMSGVKQKTVTTVTKTTHTEVKSAKSSPRKSADGDSPRVRHSPGRNGVSSKIGSLDNSRHSPGGGNVRIQSEKANYSKVQSRCGSLGNATHKAGGGNVKIFDEKVDFRTRANSRVGSLDNAHHSPGGGNVQILHDPVTFSKSASRVGSLENTHHSPHGGKVKILHDPVAFPKSSVSSKIGSLDNAQHSPGGGNVKIASSSVDFSKKAKSKIGSLDNAHHSPKGGNVKILNQSSDFSKSAKSKVGSLDNATHTPGGGNVKILNQSTDYSKTVKSKIGSLDNATHSPGGGKVKIENKKVDFSKKVTSKIGSLNNATHKPGGGNVKIEKKKLDFKEKAASKIGSKDNIKHQAGGGQVKIENKKLDFKEKAASKVGSKDNIEHKPGGGQVKIQEEKLEFKSKASSKVGSLDNASHKPGGGEVQILDEKVDFSATAQSKVGSLDNADHQPTGGDVKIFDEKPTFQHVSPRTDDGIH
ncbi:microtubule-associated protein 2-like [Lytechinus pictus]|uniref:microtubule-associated protein 2-like n=1 Tax=Lytechinus pictus TaxID=7653 RepID=UPI0030B9F986